MSQRRNRCAERQRVKIIVDTARRPARLRNANIRIGAMEFYRCIVGDAASTRECDAICIGSLLCEN
jgi:hypothetical protein